MIVHVCDTSIPTVIWGWTQKNTGESLEISQWRTKKLPHWQDGSEGKGTCHVTVYPEFYPGTHLKVEGENQFCKIV